MEIPEVEPAATVVVTIPVSVVIVDLTLAQLDAVLLFPVRGSFGAVRSVTASRLQTAEDIPTAASVNANTDSVSSLSNPFVVGFPFASK